MHGELTEDQSYIHTNGRWIKCKECTKEKRKRYYARHAEKVKQKVKEYAVKNKEKREAYDAIRRKRPDVRKRRNEVQRKYKKKIIAIMVDSYIKYLLYDEHAPPKLIELKRMTLKLKRELRTHGQK